MDDPLSRALGEAAPHPKDARRGGDVSHYHADHAPALHTVLENVKVQLVEALTLPFFDRDTRIESVPVSKNARTEVGAVTCIARRREPPYEARVSVEIRCDHTVDADDAGYEVRSRAFLRCDDARGHAERTATVTVREIDGTLQLDADALRDELAAAIRSMGRA